ncbi:MAG: nicotinate (nicotinamide) nucleotide adenylyltransferase [Lachnospiraceae bacterium]
MKIGIYGGTFDPIHYGHINLACFAAELFQLDFVYMIPSGNSYMKDQATPSNHRYLMTQMAIKPYPNLVVSNMEILRKGPSYSYETILEMKKKHPESDLYFLIGEDSLYHLYLWKNIDVLLKNTILLVAGRKSLENNNNFRNSGKLNHLSREEVFTYYKENYEADIIFFEYHNPISSSFIRNHIYDGTDLSDFLPSNIIDYIQRNQLYK